MWIEASRHDMIPTYGRLDYKSQILIITIQQLCSIVRTNMVFLICVRITQYSQDSTKNILAYGYLPIVHYE